MITTSVLVPADPQVRADLAVRVPPAEDAVRVIGILRDHPRWSAFWDKRYGLWRVAEDDPDSDLYAESSRTTT